MDRVYANVLLVVIVLGILILALLFAFMQSGSPV